MNEKVNILIVDDLTDKLLVFQSILEELQQNLVLVRSGREALQQLLERDFAVILLDVNMPDMDGFETAKLIREYRRTKQTPIVFITAYMDDIQSMRGYALGAVDYISTPVVPEILRSKVKVFVDLYSMQLQLRRQVEEREALARAEAARDAAEIAMRRADLLADASHILTRSLDIDAIVSGLLTFSLSHFASISMVMLSNDSGKIMRSSFAYYEQIYQRLEIDELPPIVKKSFENISVNDDLIELADAGALVIASADSEQNLSAQQVAVPRKILPLGAAKLLPLFARGKLIGSLLFADGGNIVEGAARAADDSLLKEIASRAAIAIDNALLYRAIRDGDRHKNEFLAMLSHELRNPLAPIRNAVHILQAQKKVREHIDADTKTQWAADVISRQVDHMTHIMNDLLDVTRIARGSVTIEQRKILFGEVVERSIETARPLLESRHHRLEVTIPEYGVELYGDLVRLAQVFSNLLNNATKYSPDGSHIWLTAAYRDEQIVVSVRDDGHGIAAEFMPHIFDLFAQGDKSIERTQSGLGVGLTLVKHLITLHHGSIEARSAGLGKGAEFVVMLPAKRVEQNNSAVAPQAGNENRVVHSGRVLVVDDLESSAQSMKLLLELNGYTVEAAYDGPAALAAVERFEPDVMLLDIGLPGMDGFEVARHLHQQRGPSTPFIIALTGYGQDIDRAKALEAGFDLHMVKPADIEKLLAHIANYCATCSRQSPQAKLA